MKDWGDQIFPLDSVVANELPAGVLCRIIKRDRKGRSFCNPRNPGPPTIVEFHPRIVAVPAGDLPVRISGRRHGIHPIQAEQIKSFTEDELLRFRLDDPISGHKVNGTFIITGGITGSMRFNVELSPGK